MILIRHGQTEFNRVFSATRRDPGIRDPVLTDHGRRQAKDAAEALRGVALARLIASPYRRALETAAIIADARGLPISVEPLVAERCAFACDIGSPRSELLACWPELDFDHLPDPWWPEGEESEAALLHRSARFRTGITNVAWSEIAVVTHWGFILALTGLKVPNGAVLRIDPTRPEREAEILLTPTPV